MARKPSPGKKARLKAQRLFGKAKQSETEGSGGKNKAAAATRSKMEELRSLRLGKEASDKAAAETKATSRKQPARRAPPDGR
jgi:hypothetical protein